jgi:Domain of unknown function (DUF5664)
MKATNPKDSLGANKSPLGLWPLTALAEGSTALANGMLKYGRVNWRSAGVRSSIYVDAMLRHILVWNEGEERDEDGVHNLAAVLACAAILIDAKANGQLVDDRPMSMVNPRDFLADVGVVIGALRELHAEKTPQHFLIGDSK